jgi:GT2 family glycosyltransferase
MGEPDVTVALITYRRPESLERALGGLSRQQLDLAWELLVVDNDPEASAQERVEQWQSRFPVPVRYLVETASGAAHARNRAISAAAAPILVMQDDDVVAPPGWLQALIAPLRDGTADCVGGRVELDPLPKRPQWFDEPGLGGYLAAFDLGPVARPLEPEEYLLTANLAARTGLLRSTNGFDPRLGPRGRRQIVSDDVQLVRDLRKAGGRIYYTPDAVVVHELTAARLRPWWLLRRSYWQGRSDAIVDEEIRGYLALGGSVNILRWLRHSIRLRRAEGLTNKPVAFHLLTDLARTAGTLRGTAVLAVRYFPQRRARRRAARAN